MKQRVDTTRLDGFRYGYGSLGTYMSNFSLIRSLLQLGDSTSRNLAFSHRRDVFVSCGEETISETNLLELRRRHARHVRIEMFSHHQEAKNGADWEWHVVGYRRSLKMRVQAKRLQRDDILKIKHTVKSTGKEQRQLLIHSAQAQNMKPIFCIYCTERQRTIWTVRSTAGRFRSYQTGCLLADAHHVPPTTRRLEQIEDKCIPWHFLFDRAHYVHAEVEAGWAADDRMTTAVSAVTNLPVTLDAEGHDSSAKSRWNPPTVDDLNHETGRAFDQIGVVETTDADLERVEPESEAGQRRRRWDLERLRETGSHRMVVMDIRDENRFPPPGPLSR